LSAFRFITLLVGLIWPLDCPRYEVGLDVGKRADVEVSCVESEVRREGAEKVEYCDKGCALDELVEFGSREWDEGGLVKARLMYPGATSMPSAQAAQS